MNDGQSHGMIDTICRLIGEGKELKLSPSAIVADGERYPAFIVTATGKNGDMWQGGPDTILSDALNELWVSIPEVT